LGGEADYYVNPRSIQEISQSVAFAAQEGLSLMVLGNGTNVLFPDEGYHGLIVHLGRNWGSWRLDAEGELVCRAGASLGGLTGWLRTQGFHDMNFLMGIPGSVGGAVAMNAGIPEATIGDLVQSVRALEPSGRLVSLERADCRFEYRRSLFRDTDWVVLEVTFRLGQGKKHWDANELLQRRRMCQPLSRPSAGCVFKNPTRPSPSAGRLIEAAGLKGCRVGGAVVSPLHANFILNEGQATSRDVRQLIDIVRNKVYKDFGVELQLELVVVSN
jgi:UDP-N-acetylmuramate dehydrogenase